jgi:hypothetical protein
MAVTTGAPYDALYYLANAYRINNQLEKALDTYEIFKKNLNPEIYDSAVVRLQMQSCLNALELMRNPLYVREKNLGNMINEGNSEFYPVISNNEDLLVFSRSEPFYDAILYSTKINGRWSAPTNMNEVLKVDKDLFPTSISNDGKTLYLYSSADFDGIIYTSRFENGTWTPLLKLNDHINTKYWESHATIAHDDKKLYFTSNRKGTIGGLDIYVSERDSTGDWGVAENLGPVINTIYNEESPFLTSDDKNLFFSSRGHFNMGGYDIFYSKKKENNEWSVPVNAGYPLNTTDDDVFFKPLNEGYLGYIARENANGYGKQDIYHVEIFSKDHPRKFLVRGMVKVADLMRSVNDSVRVSAMNITNPNQMLIVYSDPKTGEYEFQLPQGDFQLTYESEIGEKIVKNIAFSLTNPSDSIILAGTVMPKTDFVADFTVESNKTIPFTKGDTIVIPMKVEPNSILVAEHWTTDALVSSENFLLNSTVFNYKMVPDSSYNKIVFKLTDRFSNTTTSEVFTNMQRTVTEQQVVVRPEYTRVIAKKQITALTAMLMNRGGNRLSRIAADTTINNQQFGKIDDIISYMKEKASKDNVSPEELNKMALKVAVMDNVLTQAAVDLIAKDTSSDLKKALSNLDIYKANLKSWSDLQEYISKKSGSRISPEELNKIAEVALTETDPSIALLREKMLAFGDNSKTGKAISQSVATADLFNAKTKSQWMNGFLKAAELNGVTAGQMTNMLVLISSLPNTSAKQYLSDLAESSDEPLASLLKSLNLEKERIKTSNDLILFLLKNKEKGKYSEESVYQGIASLAAAKDINIATISSELKPVKKSNIWILWTLAGIAVLVAFLILMRRKGNVKK